ncbi:MAG: CPBP family intramembrane metalloprotease [Chloroflexaceae bacterium]|nr:CPBP family intramembrane metalloprotease [Chloroflexaceae bacterium]
MGITALILLLVAKIWQRLDSVTILLPRWTSEAVLLGIGLAFAITAASSLIYRLWPAYRHSADLYLELILKPLIWPDLLWLGLLPGLSEELLFRGVMLPALGFNWSALVFSSLLFGVLHLSGLKQWPYMVWATMVGFVLGYSALATGNLLVPILAHILTNFVASCLWKTGNSVGFPSS